MFLTGAWKPLRQDTALSAVRFLPVLEWSAESTSTRIFPASQGIIISALVKRPPQQKRQKCSGPADRALYMQKKQTVDTPAFSVLKKP